MIQITLSNRQRSVKLDMDWLLRLSKIALVESLKIPASPGPVLAGLDNVDVVIVSDRVIADIHRRFMNVGGATDVITFDHGEILISAQTAKMNATRYSTSPDKEVGLYMIHGLLHLNGYTDKAPEEAQKMHRVQNKILVTCLKSL